MLDPLLVPLAQVPIAGPDVAFSNASIVVFATLLGSVVGGLGLVFRLLLAAKDSAYTDMRTQLQAENAVLRAERDKLLELALSGTSMAAKAAERLARAGQ